MSALSISVADVTRSFRWVDIYKAVGIDGIPGRVLQACAFQQAGIFTDIFNLSLSLSVVLSCFKKSTIVPIPKQNKITCLNDWRPVAHLQQVFWETHQGLHLLCAACLTGSATICISQQPFHRRCYCLHPAHCSLPPRMLFVDYSSVFNTIVPTTLVAKLQTLGLNRSLSSWMLDFLTGRSQMVRMGNNTSSPLVLNSGAPTALLHSLYTHDCTATHSSNVIIKFADDTTVIGLITDNDEKAYKEEVSTLTKRCQENHLSLTIDKTPVERANSLKFFGVHITEDLTWSAHTDAVLKKAHSHSSSSWALLSFRYIWVHTVERNVVPHRTTVLHKYRHATINKKEHYKPIHN